jgi:hypothetical protein
MKNLAKITIISLFFALLASGAAIPIKTEAAQCYYPFQRVELDEIYNNSSCAGYFQVYYFPVVTDGRQYTITLHTISGEQKLYASRLKNEVDELNDLLNWVCNDDHCDSSTSVNIDTRIVSFRSPSGDPVYYSWFAVYGSTAGQYQIGISNNGVMQFVTSGTLTPPAPAPSPTPVPSTVPTASGIQSIVWKVAPSEQLFESNASDWTSAGYNDAAWKNVGLSDGNWYCNNCFVKYRGTVDLSSAASARLSFSSDDGLWLYVNGEFKGHWGGDSANTSMCVNNSGCANDQRVDDIVINNLVSGKNVISAVVYNGGGGAYFNVQVK